MLENRIRIKSTAIGVSFFDFSYSELSRGKPGRVVRKCTAISPDDRYQAAEILAKAL